MDGKISLEEIALGNIALQTAAATRQVLLDFADRNYEFKSFMLSGRNPCDAELVLWIIQKLESTFA